MYARGRERLLLRHWKRSVPLLLSKTILLPALTIPCALKRPLLHSLAHTSSAGPADPPGARHASQPAPRLSHACRLCLLPISPPVPPLAVCYAFGIDGIEARSAVLIASLPVALAAFTLGQRYFAGSPGNTGNPHGGQQHDRAGMEVIAVEIIAGSVLMPFVFLAWHGVLDAGRVFGDIPEGALYMG